MEMRQTDVDDISSRPVSFDEDYVLDHGEEEDQDIVLSGDEEGPSDAEEEDDENASIATCDEEDESAPEDPERMQLFMPSSLREQDIRRIGLEGLAAQEVELRRGQANDALQNLRLALGHKALLWRTRVRMADTTKKRTRAWDDIKLARRQVEQHVRCYHRARRALHNLGADDETLTMYKEITTADLKLSGDIVDSRRLGQ
jgi:hypothetical protein